MKIKKREGNESEENENEIDIKRNAMNDDDGEIMRDDYYSENLCQS